MADEVNENIFLVNAPAGSGKTTWIRQQVESYLLRNPKDNILCITYTNRAAEELGRDLEQSRVYFGTIHSFINDFIGSFFSHKEINRHALVDQPRYSIRIKRCHDDRAVTVTCQPLDRS